MIMIATQFKFRLQLQMISFKNRKTFVLRNKFLKITVLLRFRKIHLFHIKIRIK
jgi:hypothetical protein